MVADNSGDVAAQTPPQKSGGAGQGDDGAPIFVNNYEEYFRHIRTTSRQADASCRWIANYAFFAWFPALFHAFVCMFAGVLYPDIYQAWLAFCQPLAEYVGGLTPRAGRIAEELVAGGYPERVDDAIHGIGMARVLTIPAVVFMLAGLVVAGKVSPAVVSCTRQTHKRIWLFVVFTFALMAAFFFSGEFYMGERYDDTFYTARLNYYRGNFAMVFDALLAVAAPAFAAFGIWRMMMVRATRFNIVEQPGDKPL